MTDYFVSTYLVIFVGSISWLLKGSCKLTHHTKAIHICKTKETGQKSKDAFKHCQYLKLRAIVFHLEGLVREVEVVIDVTCRSAVLIVCYVARVHHFSMIFAPV